MNKPDFVDIIEKSSDFLENGSRAIVFTGSTFLQRIGTRGVKHCEKQARLKRNQNTIK